MKLRPVILALCLLLAPLALAQAPPPKPGPEHKKLDYFAGDWLLEARMKVGPQDGNGVVLITEHNQWMPGGFFLLTHSEGKMPMGVVTGIAIMGYDAEQKAYTFHEFNSAGEADSALGALSGDTWTWTSEARSGGAVSKSRYTVRQISSSSYSFKYEMATPGEDFVTIMEGKATRQ